jgi:hypothetical protein
MYINNYLGAMLCLQFSPICGENWRFVKNQCYDPISVDKLSVDELSVDELSVDELSVEEMSVDDCWKTNCW